MLDFISRAGGASSGSGRSAWRASPWSDGSGCVQGAEPGEPRPRETAVIQVFLEGGRRTSTRTTRSPTGAAEFRGEFRAIATNVPGDRLCELLPRQARVMDKMAIVRSLHHTSSDHGGDALDHDRVPRRGVPANERAAERRGDRRASCRGPNAGACRLMSGFRAAPAFGQGAYLGPGVQPVLARRRPRRGCPGPEPRPRRGA